MHRRFFDYLIISLKGIAMGAADVVPGVSGGTIAFISGIYEELLESIDSINLAFFKIWKTKAYGSVRCANPLKWRCLHFAPARFCCLSGR